MCAACAAAAAAAPPLEDLQWRRKKPNRSLLFLWPQTSIHKLDTLGDSMNTSNGHVSLLDSGDSLQKAGRYFPRHIKSQQLL